MTSSGGPSIVFDPKFRTITRFATRNNSLKRCSIMTRVIPSIWSVSISGTMLAISLMLSPEKTSSQRITSGRRARHRASSSRFKYPVGSVDAILYGT